MYKKFKKIFLVMAILGILFTNAYSGEVREIQLIEDISAELLEESKEQEAVVTKQPVQQQIQEITEDKNVGAEQTKKEENKVVENKEENKPKEKIIKDETKELTEKVKEVKEVQEDKNLAIEEPENPEKDKQKYEMIKYYSADGVEWELPDNFRAVIVGDTKGNVIFAKDADTMYPLASVTKMMSLMVTFDEINAGNISLSDSVRISFVAKMNRKLKEYGLENQIKYHTPAGLPTRVTKQPMDEGTARGIYKLSIEALKYKKYIEIAGIKSTKIYNGKISIRNRNHLIGENGIYGIKTGFHKEAKYNIAVASKFEDIDVIIVVMGGETYKTRDGIVLSVLDILNNNYTVKNGLIKRK